MILSDAFGSCAVRQVGVSAWHLHALTEAPDDWLDALKHALTAISHSLVPCQDIGFLTTTLSLLEPLRWTSDATCARLVGV